MSPLKSMTTFADTKVKLTTTSYSIRLRSLNSRYLDLKLYIPKELTTLEASLRALISKDFVRGKVDLQIERDKSVERSSSQISYNEDLVLSAHKTLKKMSKLTGLKYEQISDLIQSLPLIQLNTEISFKPAEIKKLNSAIKLCIDKATKQKEIEGASITKNLSLMLSDIEKDLVKIEKRKQVATKIAHENLAKKISQLNIENINRQRFEEELVVYLDRSDINEEIVRLKEHLRNFKALVKSASGKKLDFYTQELLRETNTIGSKAQDAKITTSVVNMKCLIERIRELVQNIE